MVVQNLTPTTQYRRIKGSRMHSTSWDQAELDFSRYFVHDLKRSKPFNFEHFKHLQKHLMAADVVAFIGGTLLVYELKNAQINSNLNKYYSFSPTSATLKWSSVKPSMPSFVKKRIQQLELLPNAWDSYSARPIDARAIAAAKSLLIQISDLAPKLISDVFIAPCSDGGIQLEWELNSKELIIKITPDGQQRFFLFVSSSGKEKEGAVTSEAELDSLVQGILPP